MKKFAEFHAAPLAASIDLFTEEGVRLLTEILFETKNKIDFLEKQLRLHSDCMTEIEERLDKIESFLVLE